MNGKSKNFDAERILRIIRELEHNPDLTQRDLATRLELSLGRVNFLINALIDKGIIEVKNFKKSNNKMAYMYMLTPKGIKTKIRLTHDFFVWKLQEFERLKKEIEDYKKEIDLNQVNTEEVFRGEC